MNEFEIIRIGEWKRRAIFEGYQRFDNKCFSVSFDIQSGGLYRYAKSGNHSFFLLSLYAVLKAANQVEQIRQRIIDAEQIRQYRQVGALTPVMTEEEQFAMLLLEYAATFGEFAAEAAPLVAQARAGSVRPHRERDDYITASCIPWFSFTSISQANYSFNQSTPVLGWGKMKPDGNIPFSCQFNHSLIDGLHVGRFVHALENCFSTPESL